MKIDMENVFIGTIRRCTKYENHATFSSETYIGDDCIGGESFGYTITDSVKYKESAKLLKVTKGGYVDLDLLNSFLDEIKVRSKITKEGFYLDGIIMSTQENEIGCLFVDESTLKQYKPLKEIKKPTVKKLKKMMYPVRKPPVRIEL